MRDHKVAWTNCRLVSVLGHADGRSTVAIALARTGSVLGFQIAHGVVGWGLSITVSSIVIGIGIGIAVAIAVGIVVGIGHVWLLKTASPM